jgi:nucleotide-binding universal stress UspA family protein
MKILVATDGSKFSLAAAKKCCQIVSINEDTEIRVICVKETIVPAEPFGMTDEYLALAQKAAGEVAEETVENTRQLMYQTLGDMEIDIETKVLSGGPKEMIVNEAQEWKADLIVLGSQGHGFWGRMFLGSVSDAVVKHASSSVLVLRKDDK